jgi:cysteine desulfurase
VNETERIYLDNSATTSVDPRVFEAMTASFLQDYGNPSSMHSFGRDAREAVERSRAKIAATMGASPDEIVFTSGGTESNNFALKGIAWANRHKGRHIVASAIEHDCILQSCEWLQAQGFEVTYVPVDRCGRVDPAAVESAIRPETVLVSIMHANNEIGTIEPVDDIGAICHEEGVYFHTDACQSFGKVPLDLKNLDLVTINAHKIYGPKGVGALYVREGVQIEAWQHGGGHERGLRSSTENVPGIVGFARAAEIAVDAAEKEGCRLAGFRERIIDTVLGKLDFAYLNGHRTASVPNIVSLGFNGFEGDAIRLLIELDRKGIAVSTGSACSSHSGMPSHVLAAIGLNPLQARGALRISPGRFTKTEEIDYLLDVLPQAIGSLRSISSLSVGDHEYEREHC